MVRPALACLLAASLAVSWLYGGVARAQSNTNPPDTNQSGTNPRSTRSSNIGPGDTRSVIAPALPEPEVGPKAGPFAYLRAARVALATGRTGEAQQALEMAETRLLDRSTPLFQTNDPSRNPLVARVGAARRALGAGDTSAAMAAIDQALTLQRAH